MKYTTINNFKPPRLPRSKFKIGDKARIITNRYVGLMSQGETVTIDRIYKGIPRGVSAYNGYSMYFQENWLEKIE